MAATALVDELAGLAKKALGAWCGECWMTAAAVVLVLAALVYAIYDWLEYRRIPTLVVDESEAVITRAEKFVPGKPWPKDKIPCFDPANMQLLGYQPAMTPAQVRDVIKRSRVAAETWRSSSFAQRRLLLRTLLKYTIDHMETICRASAQDSGKALLDAMLGEVLVTCEKIAWLCSSGEAVLKPEPRDAGRMLFYKTARVEYHPLGVVAAIVPWNYPFHNLLNPLSAALFAGDSMVIKVSEFASWSVRYYGRIIHAALAAVGAPVDLVQFVTGYGDAGNALVTGGVDKVIFVGSTLVGRKVMAAAADSLTPVTLELGGKDALIICEDADLAQVVPIATKAAYLSCGQNCAGGERFFVHAKIYDKFVAAVTSIVGQMRQGHALGEDTVDCGAMCMPGLAQKVEALVADAVAKGARCLAGGRADTRKGQFMQPTVLVGVTPAMEIWREEVFGPVMTIVPFSSDAEAVALANDCPFGLGSNVFSGDQARARAIASQLRAGMSSINDFATTYMCQSLPFGGVKESGFGRFAGIEGLRALCVPKAVCEDRLPWLMRSSIPPPWAYPIQDNAFDFGAGMIGMFYGPSLPHKAAGLGRLLRSLVAGGKAKAKQQ